MASDRIGRRFRAVIRGDELHIHDAGDRAVHRLAPEDVVRVLDGDRQDHLEILGEEAVDAGLHALARDRIGRRAVVTNGALAATTGIFTLWLPGSASAASIDGNPMGLGYTGTPITFTSTSPNGSTLGTFDPSLYSGATFEIAAEAAAGGADINGLHAPGRGRAVSVNFDRAAVAALGGLIVEDHSHNSGTTVTGGGGNGGQGVAIVAGGVVLLVAGGGGGAGLSAPGGDADAAAPVYTNAGGGTMSGGSPGSGGAGGAGGAVVVATGFVDGSGVTGSAGLGSGTGIPTRGGVDNYGNGTGGGGYGGGGAGGAANESPGGTGSIRASGGGGGASFVNDTYRVGTAITGYSTRSVTERCRVTFYFNA